MVLLLVLRKKDDRLEFFVWTLKFFTTCCLTSLRPTKYLLFIAAVCLEDMEVLQGISISIFYLLAALCYCIFVVGCGN